MTAVLGVRPVQLGWPGAVKLTWNEATAHMALWAIVKVPLIFGADLS